MNIFIYSANREITGMNYTQHDSVCAYMFVYTELDFSIFITDKKW